MKNNAPKLIFEKGPYAGFTPAGIAAFSDLRPAVVIRELIQNSLDAACEANKETAIVRFRLTQGETSRIPGIQNYRKAFEGAIETQKKLDGELPSQANLVVNTIEEALSKDTQDILSILDNGIGLNESRMHALLSDGVSSKGNNASGSYGNGHFVSIPASDLRYVFYGGITSDGNSIGSGHAVLASHHVQEGKSESHRSGGGFFVLRLGETIGKMYQCATDDAIPSLIMENLEDIKKTSDHGTVVVIPAFNHFRESGTPSLWKTVAQAAACNFFAAIEGGNLEIHVEDLRFEGCHDRKTLNRSSLADVLKEHNENKRSRAFLSGKRAFEAHKALRHGDLLFVRTCAGDINVRLLKKPSGNSRIDLCRNGMWIADDKKIPGFYYQFTDRKPFHAVLLLDADIGNDLHGLMRKAEGPLHDSISTKYLSSDERKRLNTALKEIREHLRSRTEELDDEPFSPDGYLPLDDGDGQVPGGRATVAFWGRPTAVQQRFPGPSWLPDPGPPGPPGPPRPPRPKPIKPRHRPALQSACQCVSTPIGVGRRRIHLVCGNALKNVELRLCVDENIDATCDRLRQDEMSSVVLSGISVNGKEAKECNILKENGNAVGVRLGAISADDPVTIETDFKLTGDFASLMTAEPSLQVQVFEAREEGKS